MFLEIPASETSVSKDITMIFMSSDKLLSKKTEITYTLTNSTYLQMDNNNITITYDRRKTD